MNREDLADLLTFATIAEESSFTRAAARLGVSASALSHSIRLLEARRLMTADTANVETAAFQVGYESPSQFSREYSRMFGAPPRREVVALKRAAS